MSKEIKNGLFSTRTPSWKRVGLEALLVTGFVGGVATCNEIPREHVYDMTLPVTLLYAGCRSVNKIARDLIDKYKNGEWPYDKE